MKKAVAILCARMTSERFPGKVLADIGGTPVLWHIVNRLRLAKGLSDIIVATTTDKADDPICQLAVRIGAKVYRGSRDDVAERMQGALDRNAWDAELIFRAMCDQPFLDWKGLDESIRLLQAYPDWDFVIPLAFHEEPVYGAGISPWSKRAWSAINANSSGAEREHVGTWLRRNMGKMDYALLEMGHWAYRPYRLELDTPDDLALFRMIHKAWEESPGAGGPPPLRWIIAYLDRNQQLASMNAHIRERTGTFTSFTKDEIAAWQRDYANRPIVWGEQLELVGLMHSTEKPYRCLSCHGMLVATGVDGAGNLVMRCVGCRKQRRFSPLKQRKVRGGALRDAS